MSESAEAPGTGAVATVNARGPDGDFLPGGRAVGARRGWDWIAEGWRLFRKQPGNWILLLLVYLACYFVIALVPLFIGGIANLVLTPVFAAGIMLGCKALDEGATLEVRHLFAGFKHNTSNLVVLGVIMLIAWVAILLIVSLIIGGGSFFALLRGDVTGLIAAGVTVALAFLVGLALALPLYMAFWFAPILVAIHDLPPVDAMKSSFVACLKNVLPFFVYGIVGMVLAVIAAIPLLLGLIVLVPVLVASIYTSYRDIFYA
jgi:uncharacterized membrane protein